MSGGHLLSENISLVILCYNSRDYVGPCLESVARSTCVPSDIVVVDNASADNSIQEATNTAARFGIRVTPVALADNRGCAGGNNAGWRASRNPLVVFLNPDTTVQPGFFTAITQPLRCDARIGIVGAKIYYPDSRRLQHAGGYIRPNAMTRHYGVWQEDTGQFDLPRETDYVTGAGFAARREVLEQLGGFDEDFFPAYFEETDLCARVRRAGWKVVYEPTAVMYHHESVSLTANSQSFRRLYQRMRIRYCMKNYTLVQWLTRFVPYEAAWLLFAREARGNRLEQFRAYAENISWWWSRRRGR